jgi:hypothetical protein
MKQYKAYSGLLIVLLATTTMHGAAGSHQETGRSSPAAAAAPASFYTPTPVDKAKEAIDEAAKQLKMVGELHGELFHKSEFNVYVSEARRIISEIETRFPRAYQQLSKKLEEIESQYATLRSKRREEETAVARAAIASANEALEKLKVKDQHNRRNIRDAREKINHAVHVIINMGRTTEEKAAFKPLRLEIKELDSEWQKIQRQDTGD